MRAIEIHIRKFPKQVIAILSMLLFLCSTGSIHASDINNPYKAISKENVVLSQNEIAEANTLSIASNSLLSFSIPQNEYVRVSIFDLNGKEISVLVNENKRAGEFYADLNNSNLTKGSYYYRLVVGKFKEVRRLNIIK